MADLTITGTHTTTTIDGAPVAPFAGVTVTDPNAGATERLSLRSLGFGGNGTLTYDANYTGPRTLTSPFNGDYELTGTAAQVTQELDALVYSSDAPPPGDSQATPISLEDFSSATNYNYGEGGYAFDDATEIIDSTPPDTVSISPQVTFRDGVFTLTGRATSVVGVNFVNVQAIVNGVPTDLGTTTVDANGDFAFADRIGAHMQGFITATAIDSIDSSPAARDTASLSLTGGLGEGSFRAEQDSYTPDGSAETSTTLFRAGGARSVDVLAAGQTFLSDHGDVWNDGGMPETTFVFDPGYGHDAVRLFRADGIDHDTLSFKGSDFGADPASQLAGVLANTHFVKGRTVITDPATQDTVKLFGIGKQQIVANRQDFTFHA